MAVRPVGIDATGVTVVHDEKNHGGVVPLAALAFGRGLLAGRLVEHRDALLLPCPACGVDDAGEWVSYSVHPVSGGCDPVAIQRMFIAYYQAHPDVPATTEAEAHALARDRCEAMDGAGRWKLDEAAASDASGGG